MPASMVPRPAMAPRGRVGGSGNGKLPQGGTWIAQQKPEDTDGGVNVGSVTPDGSDGGDGKNPAGKGLQGIG
jgi:hypothetical protein